jgi:hypothetical protein
VRRMLAGIATVVLLGAIGASGAQANNSEKPCSEADSPSSGWTTEGTQKGSCKSSHELADETVKNPGGQEPPAKQP